MALNDFVRFSNHNVLQQNKQIFFNRHNFPGIIVAIDGTHIPLYTCENQDSYRCRKGLLSFNCQVVCGPDAKIYDVVARWPGSTHDSRIFHNSSIYHRAEADGINGIILADHEYACKNLYAFKCYKCVIYKIYFFKVLIYSSQKLRH